jgi:hypothetical protein
MMDLGKLEQVDPRTVWAHEAYDFTPWLLSNADALAEVLGVDLELTANEHPVGGYSLDLIGRDLTNDCVLIVENQLATTDHSHLGQTLTYAAGTDAATIVWIATTFREEHRQALDWLNNLAGENAKFFGLEIRAVRIGDSAVAPMLALRAQPNDWHATLSTVAKTSWKTNGKADLYKRFWAAFLDRVHAERPGWTRARVPTDVNWMTMPSPIKGAVIGVNFAQKGQLRTELYIDSGDGDTNMKIFEELQSRQEEIESIFGAPLSWEDLPGKRACRIASYASGAVTEVERHGDYISWFIESGTQLRSRLGACAVEVNSATGSPSTAA